MIKINGVEIPTPSIYSIAIMDISGKAERTASGLMVRDIVATKRKIELSWNYLKKEELSKIFSSVAATFFEVDYIDPQTNGWKRGIFYAGDRSCGALSYIKGNIEYKDIKFNLVER